MKKSKILQIIFVMIFITIYSCKEDDKNEPLPDIGITAPEDKSTITAGQDVKISAFATDDNGKIARMDFYVGKK